MYELERNAVGTQVTVYTETALQAVIRESREEMDYIELVPTLRASFPKEKELPYTPLAAAGWPGWLRGRAGPCMRTHMCVYHIHIARVDTCV